MAAVVTFVVMAMSVALVVVLVVYRKHISHFLCPKDTLPQHFKEVCMFVCICMDLCARMIVCIHLQTLSSLGTCGTQQNMISLHVMSTKLLISSVCMFVFML